MQEHMEYQQAAELLASLVSPVAAEPIALEDCGGRILAKSLIASEDVPAFDRSPYDGYAFRAADSCGASREHPITLRILEEVPAGTSPSCAVTQGTAVKILTGAPIPDGADAVIMYEKTEFTQDTVTLFQTAQPGNNIVYAGEDVQKGAVLAEAGACIDPGLAGTLAGQGVFLPEVYRKPVVGIISTGSELAEDPGPGKIRNTNRYTFSAALRKDGCETVYLGTAGDQVQEIAGLIKEGLKTCDLVLLTGGVSAGDYDLTPAAMEQAGCELLFRGVNLKPGMACCYGIAEGKLVCGLSGNPSSSLTNYYAVLRPAVRKLTGLVPYKPEQIRVTLAKAFGKKSKQVRLLKGTLNLVDGTARMEPAQGQGNVMISSSIGCDVLAVIPAGTGPVDAGAEFDGFLI